MKGPLVYVGLGRKQDYDALVTSGTQAMRQLTCLNANKLFLGVDFKGKVILARYGGVYRGLKVRIIGAFIRLEL